MHWELLVMYEHSLKLREKTQNLDGKHNQIQHNKIHRNQVVKRTSEGGISTLTLQIFSRLS